MVVINGMSGCALKMDKYLSNTIWLAAEKGFRIVSGVFITVWIIRYLGPEDYGIYSYTFSVVSLFSVIAVIGMDDIVVRELVSDPDNKEEIIGTALIMKLVAALVVLFMVYILCLVLFGDYQYGYLLLIFSIAYIFQSFNVVSLYYQSVVKSKFTAVANSIGLFLSALIKIYLITHDGFLHEFVVAQVIESLFVAIILVVTFKVTGNKINFSYSNKVACKILKDSLPLVIAGSLTIVYTKVDQIMIGNLLSEENVGYYAAAIKLTEYTFVIPMLIVSSYFPKIINDKKSSDEKYMSSLQVLHNYLFYGAAVVSAVVYIFSQEIISILYEGDYEESVDVLKISIFSLIFVSLAAATSRWLYVENLQYTTIYRVLVASILNVILNYIFIPVYGITAAAYATLFSQFISSYLVYGFIQKTRQMFYVQTKAILCLDLLRRY